MRPIRLATHILSLAGAGIEHHVIRIDHRRAQETAKHSQSSHTSNKDSRSLTDLNLRGEDFKFCEKCLKTKIMNKRKNI